MVTIKNKLIIIQAREGEFWVIIYSNSIKEITIIYKDAIIINNLLEIIYFICLLCKVLISCDLVFFLVKTMRWMAA